MHVAAALLSVLDAALQGDTPGSADPEWLAMARDLWSHIHPYRYFLVLLVVFWLLARRSRTSGNDFDAQAQAVLDEKYKKGEISQKAYEKYRQDIALRPKR